MKSCSFEKKESIDNDIEAFVGAPKVFLSIFKTLNKAPSILKESKKTRFTSFQMPEVTSLGPQSQPY